MSNKRQKTGTSSSSSVRSFFGNLPSPLRTILQKIDEALEIEPQKRKWPTKDEFVVAERLLTKQGESAKDYLKEIFMPAWDEAKKSWINFKNVKENDIPKEIITFKELVSKFKAGKGQNISNIKLEMQVLQRWGIKTSMNPTQPACFMMKDHKSENDFLVMKCFCSKKGRGSINYKSMAELPLGGEICIHDFQIMENKRQYIEDNFIKIDKDFEINATNSFISIN